MGRVSRALVVPPPLPQWSASDASDCCCLVLRVSRPPLFRVFRASWGLGFQGSGLSAAPGLRVCRRFVLSRPFGCRFPGFCLFPSPALPAVLLACSLRCASFLVRGRSRTYPPGPAVPPCIKPPTACLLTCMPAHNLCMHVDRCTMCLHACPWQYAVQPANRRTRKPQQAAAKCSKL